VRGNNKEEKMALKGSTKTRSSLTKEEGKNIPENLN